MRLLARLAAAVLGTAAVGLVVPVGTAGPAAAAACSTSTGVTVLVDFNELGGGVPSVCRSDGAGRYASDLFEAAGFHLSYAQRQPGFVCRVRDVPASDPCVNTSPESAYWGLWWSTGDPGAGWTYSSLGVGSLKLPAGSLVAFSWDQVDGSAQPSAASTRPTAPSSPAPTTPGATPSTQPTHPPTQQPTQQPTRPPTQPTQPTSQPTGQASAPSPSAPATSEPTQASPSPGAPSADTSTSAGPGEGASEATPPATEPTEPSTDATAAEDAEQAELAPAAASPADDGGLPGWVPLAVIAVLFAGAGTTAVVRRRRPDAGG